MYKKALASISLLLIILSSIAIAGCAEHMHNSKYFKPAGHLLEGLESPTATLLPDGTILILGGYPPTPGPHWTWDKNTEIYDPKTQTAQFFKSMPGGNRIGHQAILLKDGRVLITGGVSGHPKRFKDKTFGLLFNPTTITYQHVKPIDYLKFLSESIALDNGKALVLGGLGGKDAPGATAEVLEYDPQTNQFNHAGYLKYGRQGGIYLKLPNNKVLIIGGLTLERKGNPITFKQSKLLDIELYDAETHKSSIIGKLETDRNGGTATLLPDNRVLITGGIMPFQDPDPEIRKHFGYYVNKCSIETFDLKTHQSKIVGKLSAFGNDRGRQTRSQHYSQCQYFIHSYLLHDGKVLLTSHFTAAIFNPKTDKIEMNDEFLRNRLNDAEVFTPDEKLYIFGGGGLPESGFNSLVEVFDYKEYLHK